MKKEHHSSTHVAAALTAGTIAFLSMSALVISLFLDVSRQKEFVLKKLSTPTLSTGSSQSNTKVTATANIEEVDQTVQTVIVE